MTLMTNDLNDHFLGGRGKGETQNRRRKGETQTRRRSCGFEIRRQKRLDLFLCGFEIRLKRGCVSPAGPFSGLQIRNSYPYGGGLQIRRNRERERKLELKNLGTSAGYGYLPVAQARYRELQRARQGIYHLQPGFARLGILYHTGTHIFLQRFRQTEHG